MAIRRGKESVSKERKGIKLEKKEKKKHVIRQGKSLGATLWILKYRLKIEGCILLNINLLTHIGQEGLSL